VPDDADNGHNGTLSQADSWLQSHIAPLVNNPAFQRDGILIIVFDESFASDTAHGGGHVAAVVVGPKVRAGYRSTAFYQHQDLLKTVLQALGVGSYPGAAASAPAMKDLFVP
jgi:acid phosphatase